MCLEEYILFRGLFVGKGSYFPVQKESEIDQALGAYGPIYRQDGSLVRTFGKSILRIS